MERGDVDTGVELTIWVICLKENGFSTPLQFASINIKDPHNQWIVSVLTKEEEELLLFKDGVQRVARSVYKITLLSNVMDYQIPHGIVDSRMYHWPFFYSIIGDWTDLIDHTFSGKGLHRKCTNHKGTLEILDPRKTSQSSWSLLVASGKTKDHHHPRQSFNTLARSKLNTLGDEIVATTYSYGE